MVIAILGPWRGSPGRLDFPLRKETSALPIGSRTVAGRPSGSAHMVSFTCSIPPLHFFFDGRTLRGPFTAPAKENTRDQIGFRHALPQDLEIRACQELLPILFPHFHKFFVYCVPFFPLHPRMIHDAGPGGRPGRKREVLIGRWEKRSKIYRFNLFGEGSNRKKRTGPESPVPVGDQSLRMKVTFISTRNSMIFPFLTTAF